MQATVILPTCNRYDVILRNIENIKKQSVPVEIIVCDDSHIHDKKANSKKIEEIKKNAKYFYTALYDHEKNKLYGLGRARNRGIIEASCDILVFLDDRITPDSPNMVKIFIDKLKERKTWLFGDKGSQKTSFVENCSATWRSDLVTAGMFSESGNVYGFMTRELSTRLARQGWKLIYVPEATAKPLCTGTRRENPEREAQIKVARDLLRKMKVV